MPGHALASVGLLAPRHHALVPPVHGDDLSVHDPARPRPRRASIAVDTGRRASRRFSTFLTLREARAWFVNEFNPESFAELVALVRSERNASFRMVLGYWDMAASLVTSGAIHGDAFRAAHGEIFVTFSKIQPFLSEMRTASGESDFCAHLEAVVLAAPDAESILARRREAARAVAQARRAAAVPPTT